MTKEVQQRETYDWEKTAAGLLPNSRADTDERVDVKWDLGGCRVAMLDLCSDFGSPYGDAKGVKTYEWHSQGRRHREHQRRSIEAWW
jgi:hypothetical protein